VRLASRIADFTSDWGSLGEGRAQIRTQILGTKTPNLTVQLGFNPNSIARAPNPSRCRFKEPHGLRQIPGLTTYPELGRNIVGHLQSALELVVEEIVRITLAFRFAQASSSRFGNRTNNEFDLFGFEIPSGQVGNIEIHLTLV
jgi:hypothetical protein